MAYVQTHIIYMKTGGRIGVVSFIYTNIVSAGNTRRRGALRHYLGPTKHMHTTCKTGMGDKYKNTPIVGSKGGGTATSHFDIYKYTQQTVRDAGHK